MIQNIKVFPVCGASCSNFQADSCRMDGLRRISSVYIPLCQLAVADVGVSCFFMPAQVDFKVKSSTTGI